jgi:CSLREA domain-containing protein
MRSFALSLSILLALMAAPALAAPFAVTSTADAVDAAPGDGLCASASDACTLRAAIQEANALAGADQIDIAAGMYRLTITGKGEDAAATGDLDVTSELTIAGAGARTVTITARPTPDPQAQGVDRIFDVLAGGDLTLSKVSLTGGSGGSAGGAIRAVGPLALTDASATANSALDGAGVWASGATHLNRVTLSNNYGANGAGVMAAGALTAINTTIQNNHGDGGGGIAVSPTGTADLTNVTLAANQAGNSGGQLLNDGSVQIRNSILEHTTPSASNCAGTALVSGGYNVDDDGSCSLSGSGDRFFNYFMWTVYELVNAGGETDVLPNYDLLGFGRYPAPGPAIDIGAAACPPIDQRGVARPQGQSCDAGAYEATFADLAITADGVPSTLAAGDLLHYSLVIRNNGPSMSVAPQLSMMSTGGASPVQGMGGVPCHYGQCDLGPLAAGASVRVDIEQDLRGSPLTNSDWYVGDNGRPETWNIDPDPSNSRLNVTVPVAPPVATTPPPAVATPPAKPCSVKKTGTKRRNVLRGTAGPDLLRGLAGNDTLSGLGGDDCLDGGSGNDVLTGGGGRDKLVGGVGSDVINAADHHKDTIDCGKGRDRATVDRIDRVKGCERVKRKR